MAKCKWCGKGGLFSRVTANKLCPRCDSIIKGHVISVMRVVNESSAIIDRTKSDKVKLRRIAIIQNRILSLNVYEQRGIPTIQPPPSDWLKKCAQLENDIIMAAPDPAPKSLTRTTAKR